MTSATMATKVCHEGHDESSWPHVRGLHVLRGFIFVRFYVADDRQAPSVTPLSFIARGSAVRSSGARPRLLSEHAPEAQPPETVQSQAEHDGCGTLFVAVALGAPLTNRTRSTRARWAARSRYAARSTAPAGTTPVVTYRHSTMSSLRANATIPIFRVRFPWPNRA